MKSAFEEKPNKHRLKREATLRSLLDAAESVFIRDGYERAQVEAIAAEAQRTKGAVYAHFRSKEDIFFALLERKAKARHQAFLNSANGLDLDQRRALAKRMFVSALDEETWPILLLEFKLFALRNEASRERVREIYNLVYQDMGKVVLPEEAGSPKPSRHAEMLALAMLRGIPSAILLEKQFHPDLISAEVAQEVLERIFEAVLNVPTSDTVLVTKRMRTSSRLRA